jgi:hypothetical protein
MEKSQSKLVVGIGPELDCAMSGWAEVDRSLRLTAIPFPGNPSDNWEVRALDGYDPMSSTVFVAIGDEYLNLRRHDAFLRIKRLGFTMPPLLDRDAKIASSVQTPENCWIAKGVIIGTGVTMGLNVHIGMGAVIQHGCRIGENAATIHSGTRLGAHVRLGDFVTVGPDVVILDAAEIGPFSRITKPGVYGGKRFEGCFIEERFEAQLWK